MKLHEDWGTGTLKLWCYVINPVVAEYVFKFALKLLWKAPT